MIVETWRIKCHQHDYILQSYLDAGGHGKLIINDALYPYAYGQHTSLLEKCLNIACNLYSSINGFILIMVSNLLLLGTLYHNHLALLPLQALTSLRLSLASLTSPMTQG